MRAALGPAGSTIIKKATRFVVLTPLFFLPQGKKSAIERWLRGREQYCKLRGADCVIVSFGKSYPERGQELPIFDFLRGCRDAAIPRESH